MPKTKKIKERPINKHIVNAITPNGIEWQKNRFYFGSMVSRIYVITKFPLRVNTGWLSKIANMDGVVCSIHITPTESGKLLERISNSITELGSRLQNGGSALMLERTQRQYKDAKKLLRKIDQEQENVFYVTVVIQVMGYDEEDLERKCDNVVRKIGGSQMKARSTMNLQEEGLLTVSPYGIREQKILDMGNRNMPISTVAAAYPFAQTGLNDGTGFKLGNDYADDVEGGIILIDTWKRGGDRTNSNWTILGLPGVGKSATVKKIFTNEYALGTKIIILDPEREYKSLCEEFGGDWINAGGGTGGRINPLQVREVPIDDDDDDERLYRDEGNGMGPLALHFQTLRTFFKLYMKDIDNMDMSLLEQALEEVYEEHNIFWNTDISKLKNEDYPIMEELYKKLKEKAKDKNIMQNRKERFDKLSVLLYPIALGADSALFNGYTTLSANADFIVLDTHNLQEADDNIRRTQFYNILTWGWQQMSVNRDEKVLFGVDEAYLIVDPDVPQALQFLRNVSKRVRKYMGGLVVITHSAVDFLDPAVKRFGQALLDNACYKFLMGTDGKNLKELIELFDLTEKEQEMISKKKRGHGLLIAGSQRIHAKVKLTEKEEILFSKGGGK